MQITIDNNLNSPSGFQENNKYQNESNPDIQNIYSQVISNTSENTDNNNNIIENKNVDNILSKKRKSLNANLDKTNKKILALSGKFTKRAGDEKNDIEYLNGVTRDQEEIISDNCIYTVEVEKTIKKVKKIVNNKNDIFEMLPSDDKYDAPTGDLKDGKLMGRVKLTRNADRFIFDGVYEDHEFVAGTIDVNELTLIMPPKNLEITIKRIEIFKGGIFGNDEILNEVISIYKNDVFKEEQIVDPNGIFDKGTFDNEGDQYLLNGRCKVILIDENTQEGIFNDFILTMGKKNFTHKNSPYIHTGQFENGLLVIGKKNLWNKITQIGKFNGQTQTDGYMSDDDKKMRTDIGEDGCINDSFNLNGCGKITWNRTKIIEEGFFEDNNLLNGTVINQINGNKYSTIQGGKFIGEIGHKKLDGFGKMICEAELKGYLGMNHKEKLTVEGTFKNGVPILLNHIGKMIQGEEKGTFTNEAKTLSLTLEDY